MRNSFKKILMIGASTLALATPALVTSAMAQSTATQEIESVTVVGQSEGGSGIMRPITVPKERSTIDQDFIKTQPAGQSIFEMLNKVPGFNFVNNDPYGNSGGNIRIHGFDGNHVSFTWDGMPLNDTGNYATYTNQVADAELIASASVNQGTTDVDSPTAAATGGVIAITTVRPDEAFGVQSVSSFGSGAYKREFLRVDSGAFGPWNTTAFVAGSFTDYDKFKGPGHLEKKQFNAELYQDLGPTGWVSLAFHWNSNRNDQYNNPSYYPAVSTPTTVAGSPSVLNYTTPFPLVAGGPSAPVLGISSSTGGFSGTGRTDNVLGFGLNYDEAPTCVRVTPVAGTAQSDANCSSFYGVRINPSDTGNIRLSSLFHLTDTLSLTVDPSIQYVLANGGGYTALAENDAKLKGNTMAAGVDLNGDGDTLDTVGVYTPSNTNTIRYGLNTSLVWRADENNTFQLAYTLDYGLHRQTGQYGQIGPDGHPYDEFGGYRDPAHRVLSADGVPLRSRDRRSHAILNQAAFAYEGNFWEDMFHVSAGVRAPFMTRDLNNLCYEQVTGSSAGFPTCTSGLPTSSVAANGTVTLPGNAATNLYVPPAQKTVNYSRILPNIGFTLSPFGSEHQFYADYAAGIAAPRTDNLYNGGNNGKCLTAGVSTPGAPGCVFSSFSTVAPETSSNYDIGYRFTTPSVQASITAYNTQFKNRIVTSYDQDLGISIDRNVGSVNVDGVDAEIDIVPTDGLDVYTSVSWEHSRVSASPLATISLSATGAPINLAGKSLVETPAWTLSQRYEYKLGNWILGIGGKYVGTRFATDANDYKVPSYATMDADITYDLAGLGWDGSYLKLNGFNLLNERYLGNISTKPCFNPAAPTSAGCGSYPTFTVGSPQTFQFTIQSKF
jgi:iron complex outermembrane receptor protein